MTWQRVSQGMECKIVRNSLESAFEVWTVFAETCWADIRWLFATGVYDDFFLENRFRLCCIN